MSPQETQALQDFLQQLTEVRGISKDAQADAMIAAAVARQPDAAYLLVQRALLVEQALNAAKAQVATLQGQVQALQASAAGNAREPGFLDGNAWGHAPTAARPQPAYAPAAPAAPAYVPPAAPVPAYQAIPAPTPSSGFFGGGMGSMLGTVAATAAGVAGGAFLYQGIEHLFNGSSGSGFAHQNGLSAPVENIENTTVNNYYGGAADKSTDKSADQAGSGSGSDFGSSNDLADLSNFDLDDSGGYDDSLV